MTCVLSATVMEDSSVCGSELMTPLRYVSLVSSELTTRERLRICCKPSFHLRRLKNKGAILVLIWNCFCSSVVYFVFNRVREIHIGVESLVQVIACGLTLSIAGWIGVVRFGQYWVIKLSM